MITPEQYTKTYERYTAMLKDYSDKIRESSECRKYLMKNTDTADPFNLLQEAVTCIYDMTGDKCFLRQVTEAIGRRRQT